MKKIIVILIFILSTLSAKEPVRVYVDIVGDLFHAGHIEFFKKAKSLGDVLVVGIHPDDEVTDYKRKPILSMDERITVISACKLVDEIIVGAPIGVTKKLIEDYKIDIVIHGDDFNRDTIAEQYGVPMEMGIFRTVPYTKGISTSDIIERIRTRFEITDNAAE